MVLLISSLTALQAAAHCAPPAAIAEVSRTYLDASRNDRAVPALIRFPATAQGAFVGCGALPVVVGHGFTIPGNRYGYLSAALVPNGAVMVFARTEEGLANHATFARDLKFLSGAVRADAQFASGLLNREVLIGHSMGGGAAVLAAALAPPSDALILLAPAETNPSAIAAAPGITRPTLLLTGSNDCVTPFAQHAGPIFAALGTTPSLRFAQVLDGGSHCQFSDGYFTCSIGEGSCTAATLSAAQQQTRVIAAVAPFLDRYARQTLLFKDAFE
jgi:dienelactone hydrolase